MGARETSAFGSLLRTYRVAAGVSQERLAERAGLSLRGVSDLERGARTTPRLETVRLLAEGLGLDGPDRAALLAARGAAANAASPAPETDRPVLPMPSTPLIGREREVGAVVDLIRREDVRLITLTGPGGVGKTRLALAAAPRLANHIAVGAVFVDLSPIRDPALVLPTVAAALGVRYTGDQGLPAVLATALRDRHLLLILDNCEQVVDAAPDIAALMNACPSLTVLATSRVVLRLAAEHIVPIPPLQLPDAAALPALPELVQSEAVAMFVARARAADPAFALNDGNSETITALVRRLDGLPLAIELAAARIRALAPEALLARLERQLPLLTGGARDAPARQRTMRDAIAWSHDLLEADERVLFRRLAIFVGGCTLEAAEAVVTAVDSDPDTVLDGITSLVDKSLVRQEMDPDGTPRYRLLETVREFGLEQLAVSGEAANVRSAHATYFLTLAEKLRPQIESAEGVPTLRRLEAEHDNLRAALMWAVDRNEAELALRLAGALWKFWLVRGHLREGWRWLETAFALPGKAPAAARMEVLYGASGIARVLGDSTVAEVMVRDLLRSAQAAKDARNIARAQFGLGLISASGKDHEPALALLQQALSGFEKTGDLHMRAMVLSSLGQLLWSHGDHEQAVLLTEKALRIWRERGDAWGIAMASANLGDMTSEAGNDERAITAYKESLRLYHELADKGGIADSLVRLARVAVAHGQPALTAVLLGAADTIRTNAGVRIPPASHADTRHPVEDARSVLSEADFNEAWRAGTRSTTAQIIERAAKVETRQAASPALDKPTGAGQDMLATPLSARELQVLRLVIDGSSDREIANVLSISHRTVTSHVSSILNKLGVNSRTSAAVYAVRHGVV